ncbi:MAG: hypothetical protein FJ034_04260 [Chloroflexi bacterium]|nr:hypothetical protein [Chloroflexota bacterium]
MTPEESRARNLDTLRRFFRSYLTADRRPLWADDARFEMPFAAAGPVRVDGIDAIARESDAFCASVLSHDYVELAIHPTIDPEVFWVATRTETVDSATRTKRSHEIVNYFRVVDGKIARRIEYFNPLAMNAL